MKVLSHRIILAKIRRAARMVRRPGRGQGLVEFALVLPLLLLLLLGIFELGRMLVIYSSVAAGSREAARYASAAGEVSPGVPYYLDQNGMRLAAERVSVLTAVTMDIPVEYDRGPGSSTFTSPTRDQVLLGDRVIITVRSRYDPILGITPLRGFDIVSTTRRTILKEVTIEPFGSNGNTNGGGNPPTITITAPNDGAEFLPGVSINFSATASDDEDGSLTTYIDWSEGGTALGSGGAISLSGLSEGSHTITASVEDTDGNIATDSVTIVVNAPPVVIIISPNADTYEQGTVLTFTATAEDSLDGDVSDTLVWFDNGVQIQTGNNFDLSTLSIGPHPITARATDSFGAVGESAVALVVIETPQPPVVTITSPPEGAQYARGTSVSFFATANDSRDGDLSASIRWSSSLDGALNTGASFSTAGLRAGTHIITASVTDSSGMTATDTVTIRIIDSAGPVVDILQPENGIDFLQNQAITLIGTASDTVDGNLSSRIRWTSSRDGYLGTGASLTVTTLSADTGLTRTPHTITAQVTDNDGLTASDAIVIYIVIRNDPPVVIINTPVADPTVIRRGRPLYFSGTATDPQDGNISSRLRWTSSLSGGTLHVGSSFTTTTLAVGTHVITASVTDNGGLTAFDTVRVQVRDFICPSPGAVVPIGNSQHVDLISWTLTIPAGTTQLDQYILTELGMNFVSNPSNAEVGLVSVDGTGVPFLASVSVVRASRNPVWTGFFRSTGTIQIIFGFKANAKADRGQSSQFDLFATFDGCPQIQGSTQF